MSHWPFGTLRPFKYGAILADPPWAYDMRSDKGYGKSPEAHYRTMSEAEIAALPVAHLAGRDCLLWLWSTWPHLEQALRVMRAWGFAYRTGGSWTKLTRTGKRSFGTGYIFRSSTEPFLVGTIGEPSYRSRSVVNLIESERREHSRKPPEARAKIVQLLPDQFACELFAREPWAGNDVWGNEAGLFGGDDAEPAGEIRDRRAEGAALLRRPGGGFAGDAVVDPESLDRDLAVRHQLDGDAGQPGAVHRHVAELRCDRDRPDLFDEVRPLGRGGRDGDRKDGEHDQSTHGADPSRGSPA